MAPTRYSSDSMPGTRLVQAFPAPFHLSRKCVVFSQLRAEIKWDEHIVFVILIYSKMYIQWTHYDIPLVTCWWKVHTKSPSDALSAGRSVPRWYLLYCRQNESKRPIIMTFTHPQPHQGFVEIYGANPELKKHLGRKFFGIISPRQVARKAILCLKYGGKSPIELNAKRT